MIKVNNRNTTTRYEICSKLTIKAPERRHWRRSGVFIVDWTYFTPCASVSIVNLEHVNADWEISRMWIALNERSEKNTGPRFLIYFY